MAPKDVKLEHKTSNVTTRHFNVERVESYSKDSVRTVHLCSIMVEDGRCYVGGQRFFKEDINNLIESLNHAKFAMDMHTSGGK